MAVPSAEMLNLVVVNVGAGLLQANMACGWGQKVKFFGLSSFSSLQWTLHAFGDVIGHT